MRWWPLAVVVLAVGAVVVVIGTRGPETTTIRLGGGEQGGQYQQVAALIAHNVGETVESISVSVQPGRGSADNVARLEAGSLEMGLVQNDAEGGAELRTVALLYDEVLHLMVGSKSGIETPADLRGKRVAVGAAGSGTATLAVAVLEHFGLPRDAYTALDLPLRDAFVGLTEGSVDAMFAVAGL
ncbi:MAG: TAXI family TRAP transporter solute-binding subunit, partial [Planctomycetota bacterium]|nr:TAXI family TRAP transporter solute-binding subunit [Planctomycetota bacterium]